MKPFSLFNAQTLLIAILGSLWLVARPYFSYADIDPQAVNHLKTWVAAEYTRYQLEREDLGLEEKALMLTSIQHLEFASVTALGRPDNMVFRIEIKPNPAQPPGAPQIRYYRLSHSLLAGWNVIPTKTSALGYYLAPFRL